MLSGVLFKCHSSLSYRSESIAFTTDSFFCLDWLSDATGCSSYKCKEWTQVNLRPGSLLLSPTVRPSLWTVWAFSVVYSPTLLVFIGTTPSHTHTYTTLKYTCVLHICMLARSHLGYEIVLQ